jgi:1-acyl-sn-glycerol-3-phosphate acyltransferase
VRGRDPGRSLGGILFFLVCQKAAHVLLRVVYGLRIRGREHIPLTGPLLVISNHESHLDPPVVGVSVSPRHIVPIARSGLFRVPLLAALIRALGSISIRENEGDAGALRAALSALGAGRCVLIFPEGSRSGDGEMQSFKRGAWLLLSRAKCDVLPVAVSGCFEAWPRTRRLPRLWVRRPIECTIGPVVPHAVLAGMKADEGLAYLAGKVAELRGVRAPVAGPRASAAR